ncbi:MAG TPA: TetR family transcriptional regulator, partial [Acidocella sp.]|nr:TetR family transcriptional regulator [Acidocella sp.]
MTDTDFDQALVTAAFALGADEGWRMVSAAAAARRAGLDLGRARARFGAHGEILRKFGELADRAALTGALIEGPVRDRLFDVLMRRFDFLQAHRAGVLALLKPLALEP